MQWGCVWSNMNPNLQFNPPIKLCMSNPMANITSIILMFPIITPKQTFYLMDSPNCQHVQRKKKKFINNWVVGPTRIAGLWNVGWNGRVKVKPREGNHFSKTYHLRYINHCYVHSVSTCSAVGFLHHHGRVPSHANGRTKIIMVDFAGMSHSVQGIPNDFSSPMGPTVMNGWDSGRAWTRLVD